MQYLNAVCVLLTSEWRIEDRNSQIISITLITWHLHNISVLLQSVFYDALKLIIRCDEKFNEQDKVTQQC